MKPDRIEDFIKNNRDSFDHMEPSPVVWEQISQKTKKPKVIRLNPHIARAAAVLLIGIVFSVILYQSNMFSTENLANKTTDPELKELLEAEAFYAQQVNGKLKEIRKCYFTFPELKEEIETDLTELENMYKELRVDLKENISNKTVIEAMIDNNRNRLKLVDDVLEQIKC